MKINDYVSEIISAGINNIVITGPTPDTVRVFKAIDKFNFNKISTYRIF